MGDILAFPEDDFRAPVPVRWRTWAAGQVATWRERRARNSGDLRGGALDGQNDYTGSAKSITCNGFGMGPSGDRQNEPEDETECDTAPLSNGLRIAANGIQSDSYTFTEPDTSMVAVSTDTQGSPRSSTNWRHLTAIRREWAEQNATMPAEIVVSVDEIRETERAVAESLYPPKGAA